MTEQEKMAAEFDKLHGATDGYVTTDVWVLFSDGAKRSVTCWGPAGYQLVVFEADSKECRASQKEFWEIRLQNLVNEFEQLKQRTHTASGGHFKERLAELKALQTAVRSARTKVSRLATLERGFTQSDVQQCWECWNELSQALAEESHAQQKFDSALLGKSSPGQLERLKAKLDQAKRTTARRVEKWNSFEPTAARDIVAEALDQEARSQREHELSEIEV